MRANVSILIADFPASPETEQLLSARVHGNTIDAHAKLQPEERWPSDKTHVQGDVSSSSRTTSRDKPLRLNGDVSQVGETSDDAGVAIRLPSIANVDQNDDDPPPYNAIPPPYSAITPLNHVSWPYGIFSFGHSYSTDRAEMPMAFFQVAPPAPMDFHGEGDEQAMPYQFFKFGCRRSSVVPRETSSLSDNGIAEKIDDTKSRSKPIPSSSLNRGKCYYSFRNHRCKHNERAHGERSCSPRVKKLLSRLSAESVKVSGDLDSKTHAILCLNLKRYAEEKVSLAGSELISW